MSVHVYEPLNTLKPVAENIWIVDGPQINMDIKIGSIPFSTRMTIIKLNDGSLWCHSPIQATPNLIAEINQLGPVKHLVSPNMIHYAYISEWQNYYPDAIAWASPGVDKRAASQNIEVTFDHDLTNQAPPEWSIEIDQLIFKGSAVMEEVVFFHKSSQTLILADLIENFEPQHSKHRWWRLIYKLAGIAHPDGKTPLDFRLTFTGNKITARKSYYKMLGWQPEKIILAHGRWYDMDGVAELKRSFRWLEK
ncbi:DUF4336 domain-containing protein [Aerococcaceae bacterium DSM 111176]|nr:DUF4336 domain-containing protein [Aerococcaceae bacterium DSM 111176]